MPEFDPSQVAFRKSTRSVGGNNDCVEIADLGSMIAVRDSKDPRGPVLILAPRGWQVFSTRVKIGDYDCTKHP